MSDPGEATPAELVGASAPGSTTKSGHPFDADGCRAILRSFDGVDFHLDRHHLNKLNASSSVLKDMLDRSLAPSPPTVPQSLHPTALSLPENGTILSMLLSSLFPIHLIYRLATAVTLFRIILAESASLLITRQDAFRAFCLARQHRLVEESFHAANIAASNTESIEEMGRKLLFAVGPSMAELQQYRSLVEKHTRVSIDTFLKSQQVQTKFRSCTRVSWIHDRVRFWSLNRNSVPSRISGPLKMHASGDMCSACGRMTANDLSSFFSGLEDAMADAITKAQDSFRVACNATDHPKELSYTRSDFGAPFDRQDADVILRSSDFCDFRVHKGVLALASTIFESIFTLPSPQDSLNRDESGFHDGLPIIQVTEHKDILQLLLTLIYPIDVVKPASYEEVLGVLSAAQKYLMTKTIDVIRDSVLLGRLPGIVTIRASTAYALAARYRLDEETLAAVVSAIQQPFSFKSLGDDLHLFDGASLYALSQYRIQRKNALESCLRSAMDLSAQSAIDYMAGASISGTGFGTIIKRCRFAVKQGDKEVPAWWHDFFFKIIMKIRTGEVPPVIDALALLQSFSTVREGHIAGQGVSGCYYWQCAGMLAAPCGERFCRMLEDEMKTALDGVGPSAVPHIG
ncbi:hypothetical protein BC834DRAFT_887074 [Gloeopeniophorella convolvens]|nr:hypothetical protein BC834DRAFT_887074 [Gloeopeniophorella convolvens]